MTGERGNATRARRNLLSVAHARRLLALDLLMSLGVTGAFLSLMLDASRCVTAVDIVILVFSWLITAWGGASLWYALRRQAATATGAES